MLRSRGSSFRGNRRSVDEWLQDGDHLRKSIRDALTLEIGQFSQRYDFEEMAPICRPALEFDCFAEFVFELDDETVEVCEIRGSADRTILEVQSNFSQLPVRADPNFIVHSLIVVIDLHQLRYRFDLETSEFLGQFLAKLIDNASEKLLTSKRSASILHHGYAIWTELLVGSTKAALRM
jgi:hypothetical protein